MKKITGCLILMSCSAPLAAIAQPFYLGDQEVSVEQAAQVQSHCESLLAQEEAQNDLQEMSNPFEDPPEGLGEVGNDEALTDDDEEDDDDGPDLGAISLEDCRAAGLVP